jgi:DNA-binding NarL/FixJ family response regulator
VRPLSVPKGHPATLRPGRPACYRACDGTVTQRYAVGSVTRRAELRARLRTRIASRFTTTGPTALAALAAGARGFLTKNAGRSQIAQAIHAAAAGLAPMDAQVQARLVAAARVGQVPRELPAGLTRREAEVLALIAAGLSNAAIAQRLHVSHATVKTHVNRIFAKAGVADRPAAAQYARDHELIAPANPSASQR